VNFVSILEDETRAQAEQTASMPFVQPHLALMPDAHLGKGATVGSVTPTLGAVIRAAAGVDIGCGMMAVRTQLTVADLPDDRRALHRATSKAVPLSAGRYNVAVLETAARRVTELEGYGRRRTGTGHRGHLAAAARLARLARLGQPLLPRFPHLTT
jgi:tRNA-splicing ligase RtcB